MGSPFLYFLDQGFSVAELSGARLDGDLVEIGDAYMPTDAVETRELRAASLRPRLPPALAATRCTAAWVHGAIADPPVRVAVQRRSARRLAHVVDVRLSYRDRRLPPEAAIPVAGIWVTTPAHTLAELARTPSPGPRTRAAIEGLAALAADAAPAALAILERSGAVPFKRAGVAVLRALVDARSQEEVTR